MLWLHYRCTTQNHSRQGIWNYIITSLHYEAAIGLSNKLFHIPFETAS
ncbi:MAG: hypothetical protein LBT09_14395 [Planctomycetaceae bacterium]|nr:hypothetical protein [Planctomycetaceae bacterium]